MFEQECNACQGTREFDFVTLEGELKHETCPYCASDYAYDSMRRAQNAQESVRLAIVAAIFSLEKSLALRFRHK